MPEGYNFSDPNREKNERATPVVNVCEINGVESGIPADERGIQSMDSAETTIMYTEALKNNTAAPVFVGMPHAGEYAPKAILDRISDRKAFVDGLDAGNAMIFSPQQGENYLAARNRISRLVADPNRGPQQYRQGAGVGGVTWTNNFRAEPIYKPGQEPTDKEMAENVDKYYTPYYRALHALIASLHEKMGYKNILFLDTHSFPGATDVPQIGLVASESKPLFILGSQGDAKASVEVMRMVNDALTRYAPPKEEFPEMYQHISETVHEESKFGWGGARNVGYFGHPEGTGNGIAARGEQEEKDDTFRIHAIQLEMNMSAFYDAGKYNQRHLEALRQTMQKALKEVGDKLKEMQNIAKL